jgi:hypothetical protein
MANSLSFWFSAFNTAVLNFVQLILIKRLFGTLAVADPNWALKVEHVTCFRWIARLPAMLRTLIIATSVISTLARTAELAAGILVTARVFAYASNTNASVMPAAEVLQVGRRLRGLCVISASRLLLLLAI